MTGEAGKQGDAMRVSDVHVISRREDLPSPSREINDLLDTWRLARCGALVPLKQNFDPLAVPHLLPSLWLYRLDRGTDTFTCRLAGERINAAWGYSIAGHTSEDIFGVSDNAVIVSIWMAILETPLVHYGRGEVLSGNSLYLAERLVLPLLDEAGEANFILGLSLYDFGSTPAAAQVGIVDNGKN